MGATVTLLSSSQWHCICTFYNVLLASKMKWSEEVSCYDMQVYKGPGLIPSMKQELLRCLEADGFSSVEDAVGADHY